MAHALPQFLAQVRGDGREQGQHRGHGRREDAVLGVALAQLFTGQVHGVDQFHDRGDGGVELEAVAHVLGDLLDRQMLAAAQVAGFGRGHVVGTGAAGLDRGQALGLVHEQTPDAVQEARGAFDAAVGPGEVTLRRRGEEAEQTHGVRAVLGDHGRGVHHIALGLGHLAAVLEHHALGEQVGEGLVQAFGVEAQVAQDLGEEAGVEQVQDGVFHTADVLVHGQPVLEGVHIEGALGIAGAGVAGEVPGGLHEGVQGIGLATGLATADGAGAAHEGVGLGQGRAAVFTHMGIQGQEHGQVLFLLGHHAALVAVDDRDGGAPVTLARDVPVTQAELRGGLALAFLFQTFGHGLLAVGVGHAVEVAGIDHHAFGGEGGFHGGGTSPSGLMTTLTGRPYLRANSKSRWSWAGTPMTAPVP